MGKTTLLEHLVPELKARGMIVSVIKHSHKDLDIDRPGKDSYRLRETGCQEVLVMGRRRWVLMHELSEDNEPPLPQLLDKLQACDLVLIEGFKQEPVPKLEVYRPENGKPPLFPERNDIVAVATDAEIETSLPKLPLNDVGAIAGTQLRPPTTPCSKLPANLSGPRNRAAWPCCRPTQCH